MVTAVVEPFRLDAVEAALAQAGVQGMTVTEVHHRSAAVVDLASIDLVPRVRVELLVDDAEAGHVLGVLEVTLGSDDGRVWSTPLSEVLRVRTGERGAEAL